MSVDLEIDSPMFCEHANECPVSCPCPPNCYCKTHTCKPMHPTSIRAERDNLRQSVEILRSDRDFYQIKAENYRQDIIKLDECIVELEAILENLPPKPTIPPPKIEIRYSNSTYSPEVYITVNGQQFGECIRQSTMTPKRMDKLISEAKEMYYIIESHKLSDQGMIL